MEIFNRARQNFTGTLKKIMSFALLLSPLTALAQNANVDKGLGSLSGLFGGGHGLAGSGTLTGFITNAIDILLYFVGSIAVVFMIIGGYQYITSGGNEETAEKGKKTLINAIIGIVVVVLSYAIVSIVSNEATYLYN